MNLQRRLKQLIWILFLCFLASGCGTILYLQQPKLGALPDSARLETVQASPHYRNGQFENLIPTPTLIGKQNFLSASWNYLVQEKKRAAPSTAVPSKKTNLMQLNRNDDIVVWLGHSSYYIQLQGSAILVDPVLSESAAPIPGVNRAFFGANPYTPDDIPAIDILLISHDHWDHLDYPTLAALQPKIKTIVCGLGVGAHLARWGFRDDQIQEGDWFTAFPQANDLTVHILPARHYSGRLLTKNQSLWAGFALTTPSRKLLISGDSGYGPHFKEIGAQFGGFDLVMLDNGQYDASWPYIHMTPEEASQAAADLAAQALLPGHAGKFSIANHTWDDPFIRIAKASQTKAYRLLTPQIGETVDLSNPNQRFSPWWEELS